MAGPWERYAAPSPAAAPRAQPQRQQRQQIRFADDLDAVTRTLIGEAANQGEQGMLAVGGVIANRARQRGLTPSQVVLERNQFEPWGNPSTTARLLSIDPQSPEYQSARVLAQRALSGDHPVGNASHFYAPRAQAALGRAAPSWDNGTGRAIGDHLFFDLEGGAQAEPPAGEGPWARYAAAPAVEVAQPVTAPPVGTPLNTDIKDGVWVQGTGGDSDWTYMSRERADRLDDPEYQRAFAEAQNASANVPDRLRALGLGGTYGFLTDINAEAQRVIQGAENIGRRAMGQEIRYGADVAAQAARDAMRDDQAAYAAEKPLENFGLQFAGGILAPGAIQGGQYINAARGSAATGRAAQVGAGMGLASGLGYSEGNLLERAPDAAVSGAVGGALGAGAQMGLNRLGRAGEGGGAARRLSRQGVDLTPGQMLAEVPVAGSSIRYAEDLLAGYNPLMTGVRQRQNEDVIRVAGQEALDNIGVKLPRNARTGREVYNATRTNLSSRYDEVTDRIGAVLDDDYDLMMDNLRRDANQNLDADHAARFNRILDENVLSEITPDGGLSGDSFKRIETTLRQQAERASRPGATLQDDDYVEALNGAREVFRDVIARQFPDEAENIRGLNRGWAINARIRRAVSGSAGFGRDGTPTPGELSQSVRQLSSEEQIAQDRGLLQGLAQDARTVLPATMGDTGSGQRAVVGGALGMVGTGAVAAVNPALAGMIATGAVVYSRPGIALLNLVYRATDSQQANDALRQLADQARRNPALLPYYEDAARHALSLSQRDTQGASPAPASMPAPTPALQRVLQ